MRQLCCRNAECGVCVVCMCVSISECGAVTNNGRSLAVARLVERRKVRVGRAEMYCCAVLCNWADTNVLHQPLLVRHYV